MCTLLCIMAAGYSRVLWHVIVPSYSILLFYIAIILTLDLLAAILQAYVFSLLCILYARMCTLGSYIVTYATSLLYV